ncbi:MAG: BlaI/MecI/CopY family transcriptional regulator [Saprospiraceae bacterium]
MSKNNHQPSEAELEILQILWNDQPLTVRGIYEMISQTKNVGYTTVLKQMQRMEAEKGLLTRYKEGKVHYYSAAIQKTEVQTSSLNRFVDAVFNGSTSDLIMHALGNQPTSRAELEELEKWLKAQKDKL